MHVWRHIPRGIDVGIVMGTGMDIKGIGRGGGRARARGKLAQPCTLEFTGIALSDCAPYF